MKHITLAAALLAVGLLPAQLPPEIEMDRHTVRAEQHMEEGNFYLAMQSLDRALALQKEHGIEVPEEFLFAYGQVSLELERYDDAIESVTEYLTRTGREGEHYRAALELLNGAEEEKARAEAEAKRAEAEARRIRQALAGMEFVRIPAGEYLMGSGDSVWRVRISQAFELGKHEVTQEQWEAVMGGNPSGFSGCGSCPVENVSWEDAQAFIGKLNAAGGESPYRLPTEAEWEYALRAGTTGERYAGNVDAIAWHDGNSGERTHPVGEKAPNAWGLHDMQGNVSEWVQDWFAWPQDRPRGPLTDPRGPAWGDHRIVRGCGWDDYHRRCDALDYRAVGEPDGRNHSIGFRLLRTK